MSIPSEAALRRTLRDHVFSAMLTHEAERTRSELLRDLLLAVAAKLAQARGLRLAATPPTSELDALATDLALMPVTLLGDLYADLLDERHAQGSYFTPRALAQQVVKWTLTGDEARILDPAMGTGHFLIAAAEHLAGQNADSAGRWQALGKLYGADLDPVAVELARISLWLWAAHPGTAPADLASRLRAGDSLSDDLWGDVPGGFDAVIGNPPYLSVFARARVGDGSHGDAYETASGSYDLAVPFVEHAIRLTRAGGCCGLVLPNKLLATDYARALRLWLREHTIVECIADYTDAVVFEAGVYPIACVFRHSPPDDSAIVRVQSARDAAWEREYTQRDLDAAPGNVWSPVLDPRFEMLRQCWQGSVRPLGDCAHIAAGLTVSEAYNLRDTVIDAPPTLISGGFIPLITTGLIGRHRLTWGGTRTQFLKRSFRRPVVPDHILPPRRREQVNTAKLLVAGLGLTPRAALDRGGMLASVGALIVYESLWPLGALCAWLNSELIADVYRALYGGLALSGGYLRFGKRELSRLPLPDVPPNDPRITALDALGWQAVTGSLYEAEINRIVRSLYGLEA
jgi:hypothetical protein